ncbi:hypothetical protein HLH33_19140 [Gluconacetobacter diazotrophicus]|uniref:Uncharacterized protein n=1 Tax=Gluconacetobacter diazotrophicus TaxID=33996 RepID=A0A7W4I8T7_GLUDI|nr:hypothetical protein [Gluconacetobacter diazotrophicus]MBB2158378.1 hypothetical protein [Gluconacetobacter diazotrophicus]
MTDSEYWSKARGRDYEAPEAQTIATPAQTAIERERQEAARREERRIRDLQREGPAPQTPEEVARRQERLADIKAISDADTRIQKANHGVYDHLKRWDRRADARDSRGQREANDILNGRERLVADEISAISGIRRGLMEVFEKKWNDPEPHLSPSPESEVAFSTKAAEFDAAIEAFQQALKTRPPPIASKLMDPTAGFQAHVRQEQIGKPPTTDAEREIYAERMRDLAAVDATEGTRGHEDARRAFDRKWLQPERDARKATRLAAENPDRAQPIAVAAQSADRQPSTAPTIRPAPPVREQTHNPAGARQTRRGVGEIVSWPPPRRAPQSPPAAAPTPPAKPTRAPLASPLRDAIDAAEAVLRNQPPAQTQAHVASM